MRSTRANIYIKNLLNNYNEVKRKCKNISICAAVKADAYGHGAIKIAKTLEEHGCDYFCVATSIEAKELVLSGIKSPIIILSLVTPDELPTLVELNIEPVVTTIEYLKLIEKVALNQNKIVQVHLKIDTGMGRIGCSPENALKIAKYIKNSKHLKQVGLCTHFSSSDSLNQKNTNLQLKKFTTVIDSLKNENILPEVIHCANSGAIIMNKDSIFNMVRPGIVLYGYPPDNLLKDKLNIKPVLELETKIVDLKKVPKGTRISYGGSYITKNEENIATLPIGYADGYSRSLSNSGVVIIDNKEFPIVGRICMDQMMIKVDDSIDLYDKVLLISTTDGQPNAETIAQKTGTISYEVLTNIHRVKKYYIFW